MACEDKRSAEGARQGRILIVDGDRRVRQALRALLEADGVGIVVGDAGDAERLRALVPVVRPTVVVLDLLLPTVPDGLRLVRELADRGTCVVVVSALVGCREAALAAGAAHFLEKCLDPDRLLRSIAEIIGTTPSLPTG